MRGFRTLGGRLPPRGTSLGRRLDEKMSVDAAEAESGQRRAQRSLRVAARPGRRRGRDIKRAVLESRGRICRLEIRVRRYRVMIEGEQDLHEPRRAGGGEQMADVGLHRADRALSGSPAALAPQRLEARDLDGIARRRAGRVALDEIDLRRRQRRFLVRGPHGPQLADGVGGEEAAPDVVREPAADDHAADAVAVAVGVRQALEHEHPGALSDDEPVGRRVERGRRARRRQRAQLREAHLGVEALRSRDAARQHRVGAAGAQLLHRELQRIERGRAGRVERPRAAAEAEGFREHAAREPGDEAVRGVAARRGGRGRQAQRVALEARAQQLSRPGGRAIGRQGELADHDARALAVPGGQLRVDHGRARGVKREVERGIERQRPAAVEREARRVEREILDETAFQRVDLVGRALRGVERGAGVDRPAPRRDLLRGTFSCRQILPEPLGRRGVGEDSPRSDDRDRLRFGAHRL